MIENRKSVRRAAGGRLALPGAAIAALVLVAPLVSPASPPAHRIAATQEGAPGGAPSALGLTSPAFDDGETIPRRFTCDGGDRSPPLGWDGIPDATRSLALIVDDPDAPARRWVHWVYYDLPPELAGLPESIPAKEQPGVGGTQGRNDFGTLGYGGPCPPRGSEHRYVFNLFALDTRLELPAGATKARLLAAMEGHVIAAGRLTGTYRRR